MSIDTSVHSVAVPADSWARQAYTTTHLADAFETRLPPGTTGDVEALARFILENQAPWVGWLMNVRDAIVGRLGLKTASALQASPAGRIGIFKVYARREGELLLGEDDKHLDFRLSVLRRESGTPGDGSASLVLSTVVHCHNGLGRTYIFVIEPFHRLVVKSALRRAARRGWPRREPGKA